MVLKGRSILPSWDNIILTFGTMVSISRTLFFNDRTRMRVVLLVMLYRNSLALILLGFVDEDRNECCSYLVCLLS